MAERSDIELVNPSAWHGEGSIIDLHIRHEGCMSIGESLTRETATFLRDQLTEALNRPTFELPTEAGDIVLVNGGATWVLARVGEAQRHLAWQNVNGDRKSPEDFAEFVQRVTGRGTPTLQLRLSDTRHGRTVIEELYRP